jgi:tyrosyl-tRNA synthetase
MGRDVMQHYGLDPQAVVTYELLVGTDGAKKMAKSEGNYIAIEEEPDSMFGKVMSLPDEALEQWWRLTLDREAPAGDPMESKLALARAIVEQWHGEEAAAAAEAHFTRVVREGKPPEEVEEAELPGGDVIHLPALLVDRFGLGSTSEARRLIAQGGVRIEGEPVEELDLPRERLEGRLVQAGKRRFLRFRAA